MSRPPYVPPYLYLIYSSTTESSKEVNTIESLPIRSEPKIAQKSIYSSTAESSEEVNMIESLPMRSEHQIVQKPIYSLTTEFQFETRMPEESSKIESLPIRSEPQIAENARGAQMSSVGSPKLSTLCHISFLFLYSLHRI